MREELSASCVPRIAWVRVLAACIKVFLLKDSCKKRNDTTFTSVFLLFWCHMNMACCACPFLSGQSLTHRIQECWVDAQGPGSLQAVEFEGIYRTQEIPSLQDLRPHGSNRSR